MRTPPARAPFASAWQRSAGFALPSPGSQTAARRSSVRISGQSRPASAGEISSISTPKLRARATVRLSSTTRAGVLDIDAAAGLPTGGLAGLRLERAVELDAVAAHAGHGAGGPHLADQARRVPGRAARDPALLQHQHVALAELRQVIGEAASDDAAADDDD